MSKIRISNDSGFSFIDIMMAAALSSVIISICYSLMLFQLKQLREIKALYVQNVILARFQLATSSINLKSSATDVANVDLRACLAAIDGLTCSSAEVYPLKLIDGTPISGFPDEEVGYGLDGQKCEIGVDQDCVFKLSTSFRVQCAEDSSNPYWIPPSCPTQGPALIEVFSELSYLQDGDAEGIVGLKTVSRSVIIKM